jgi:hypothetical protein
MRREMMMCISESRVRNGSNASKARHPSRVTRKRSIVLTYQCWKLVVEIMAQRVAIVFHASRLRSNMSDGVQTRNADVEISDEASGRIGAKRGRGRPRPHWP